MGWERKRTSLFLSWEGTQLAACSANADLIIDFSMSATNKKQRSPREPSPASKTPSPTSPQRHQHNKLKNFTLKL